MPEIRLSASVVIQVKDGSALDALMSLSPHQAMARVVALVEDQLSASSPFADWLDRSIERAQPEAGEDLDDLFVSYVAFCRKAEVELAQRLTFARFGRALAAEGLAHSKSGTGRPIRLGCRLRDWSLVPEPDPAPIDLAAFLDTCCTRGPKLRARASLLHAAYEVWAAQNDRKTLPIKRFRGLMLAAGFKCISSNGRWWIGLQDQTLISDASPLAPLLGGDTLLPRMEG